MLFVLACVLSLFCSLSSWFVCISCDFAAFWFCSVVGLFCLRHLVFLVVRVSCKLRPSAVCKHGMKILWCCFAAVLAGHMSDEDDADSKPLVPGSSHHIVFGDKEEAALVDSSLAVALEDSDELRQVGTRQCAVVVKTECVAESEGIGVEQSAVVPVDLGLTKSGQPRKRKTSMKADDATELRGKTNKKETSCGLGIKSRMRRVSEGAESSNKSREGKVVESVDFKVGSELPDPQILQVGNATQFSFIFSEHLEAAKVKEAEYAIWTASSMQGDEKALGWFSFIPDSWGEKLEVVKPCGCVLCFNRAYRERKTELMNGVADLPENTCPWTCCKMANVQLTTSALFRHSGCQGNKTSVKLHRLVAKYRAGDAGPLGGGKEDESSEDAMPVDDLWAGHVPQPGDRHKWWVSSRNLASSRKSTVSETGEAFRAGEAVAGEAIQKDRNLNQIKGATCMAESQRVSWRQAFWRAKDCQVMLDGADVMMAITFQAINE